ncbi:MAG: hypothetical protein ACP5OR_02625 [Candidatus Dormibacteria bacterium]
MNRIASRRTRIASGVAAVGITLFAIVTATMSNAHATVATPVTISGIPAATLATDNIHLFTPSRSLPAAAVSAVGASATALAAFPNVQVRSTTLAQVSDPGSPIVDGRTLWVVSVTPPDAFNAAPPNAVSSQRPAHPLYMLVFIDPSNGAFLMAVEHSTTN